MTVVINYHISLHIVIVYALRVALSFVDPDFFLLGGLPMRARVCVRK